jgi:heme-degrading monooxygenase HmoA
VFVELHLHTPLEGRSEDTRLVLHEAARQLKSEHGLRQVSVLEETDGRLCLMSIWESDLSCVDPSASNVLHLAET